MTEEVQLEAHEAFNFMSVAGRGFTASENRTENKLHPRLTR